MLGWGAVTIGTGFTQNFHDLVICRVFLGIAEAGQYPGCAYYLTLWVSEKRVPVERTRDADDLQYAPQDLAFRQGMFFSAASAAGAFSGLLAYGIDHMDGISGLEGWRWM